MTISRRRFLHDTAAGGIALAVVGSGGCGNDVAPAPLADATVDDDINSVTYGQVQVTVARYPQLAAVGGAITLQLQKLVGDATRAYVLPPDETILLVQYAADQFVALQSSCPHAGCALGYSAHDRLVECPCHSSRFRAVADPADSSTCPGEVVHSPARSPLTSWKLTYDGTTVVIDLKSPQGCSDTFPAVVDGTITLPLASYPQLAMTGQSMVGLPTGLGFPIIVARIDGSTAVAVASTCTHQGCTVGYDTGKQDFACPCHGSVFALDGSVVNGPAVTPLKSLTTKVTATAIVITVT